MPNRRRVLYPYHRSTLVEALCAILTQICTTDAEGEQIGLDKQGAQDFLDRLLAYTNGALYEMKQVVGERTDDKPVEASADLVDRCLTAMRVSHKKEQS